MSLPADAIPGRWHWRTGAFVGWSAPIFGVGSFFALAGTTDGQATVAGRVTVGLVGALLGVLMVRAIIAGLHVDDRRARVRGLFATRSVPRDRLAGVLVETSVRDRWRAPSVVSTDGRVVRARWASGGTKSGRAVNVASAGTAVLHGLGIGPDRLRYVIAAHGIVPCGVAATVDLWRSPPNWPPPPPGWSPPSGWYPPPDWPQPPPGWQLWTRAEVPLVIDREYAPEAIPVPEQMPERLDRRYRLDRAVAATLPGSNWGLGEAIQAFGWVALLYAVITPVDIFVSSNLAQFLGESSIGAAVLLAARKAAGQSGGWRRALGWDLPRLRDLPLGLRWFGWQSLASFVAGVVLTLVTAPLGGHEESNVDISRHDAVTTIVVAVVVAVIVAPVVEEFFFRGLLLRAAMRRFSFWPSAIVTSVIFGLAHVPEVHSARSRIVLGGVISVFGVVQCLLARRKARLGPTMVVHGLLNAMSVVLALS